jgi:large subunit ribosomal protein L29
MNVDKIRNLTDVELSHQERELSDQLFKMKFQLKMGQTESLKKIRELKKDIARVLTVQRQKQIAGGNGAGAAKAAAPAKPAAAKAKKPGKAAKAKKPVAAKKVAKKKAATEKK